MRDPTPAPGTPRSCRPDRPSSRAFPETRQLPRATRPRHQATLPWPYRHLGPASCIHGAFPYSLTDRRPHHAALRDTSVPRPTFAGASPARGILTDHDPRDRVRGQRTRGWTRSVIHRHFDTSTGQRIVLLPSGGRPARHQSRVPVA